MTETTDNANLELAKRVAEVFPLPAAINEAYKAVVATFPYAFDEMPDVVENVSTAGDDTLDYMHGAASVYQHLVEMARVGGMHYSNDEYVAWLAEAPAESWFATDGDFRWWLDGLLAENDPELAAEWAEMTEHAFD